jgi:hypothetical protein
VPYAARCWLVAIVAAIVLAAFCRPGSCASSPMPVVPVQDESAEGCRSCAEFNRLTIRVRDGEISRTAAQQEMARLFPTLRAYYYGHGGKDFPEDAWVFPLMGYSAKAVGEGSNHGYEPRGYDYFAGNRHGGHPAFDIFIRDRDQNERDDLTGDYVAVLSLTGGVVVALEPDWEAGSLLRGGKYLWVYDPASDALVYYAHNRQLFVGLGDLVRPGDLVAEVGRTGLNAYRKRSPTHLHLSYLKIDDGTPLPKNIYQRLTRCRTMNGIGLKQEE